MLISAAVQEQKKKTEERAAGILIKGCIGNSSMERGEDVFCPSSVAEQVWLCASMGSVPTRRQCVANTDCNMERCADRRDADRRKSACGGEKGVSEADQQNRFSVHLHVKWSHL